MLTIFIGAEAGILPADRIRLTTPEQKAIGRKTPLALL